MRCAVAVNARVNGACVTVAPRPGALPRAATAKATARVPLKRAVLAAAPHPVSARLPLEGRPTALSATRAARRAHEIVPQAKAHGRRAHP